MKDNLKRHTVMMNDALMQMKSRHNNKTTYLTGIARRALLLFTLLLCVGGSVWGQVMNVSTGIVDSQNYGWFKSSFPNNITSAYINEIYDGSWSGLSLNQSEHWNGNTGTQYADSWSTSPLSGYRTTTVNLPKGKYILLAAGRGSAGVTLSMKIAGKEVTMAGRGNTGKGVTISGEASFDSGEFANDGNGFGWEYFFISFEVGDGGANGVEISVGGTSTEGNKWMSFTTPQLWKAPDDVSSTDLTAAMFHNWSSPNAGATDNGAVSGAACVLNESTGLPYGDGNVYYRNYADLSNYKTLELVVLEGAPRLLFNRQTDNGNDYLEINSTSHSYVRALNSLWIIDLEKIRANYGGYVHLNCIKGANYANVKIKSMTLRGYPTDLASSGLFKEYDSDLTTVTNANPNMDNHFGTEVADQGTIYGLQYGSISSTNFANLSGYTKLVIAYSGNIPRLVFNDPDRVEINSGNYSNYATIEDGLLIIDLAKLRSSNGNQSRLNSIKAWGGATTINSIHLYTEQEYADINTFTLGNESNCETHVLYQLDPNSGNFTVDLAKFKDKILSYFGKTGNSFNGFGDLYLRWYVIDNATSKYIPNQDEILNAVGNSGGNHHKEDIGMLWFDNGYATAITDDNCSDVLNASVSLPTGKTATDVTLVCVMTDDVSDLYIKHEPQNLKHKILIRFISNWDAESNSDFILSNSTPSQTFSTQVNMEQGATETVEGQLQTALVGLYNQASASSSSLNGAIPQYVRVYLTNSNGVMINATNGYWTSLFSKADSYQNKRDKGYVWAKTEWSSFNINNIVNTVLTKPDGYDWSNVRVVCDLTDDLTGSYFVGTGLMEEPTNLKARLIVSFKEKSSDAYSATSSEMTTGMTITRKHYSTVTANLDLATSENFTDVNAKFDGHLNDNSNLERLYIRWYIADKDGEWIPTPEGITLSPVYAGYADKVIGENNYGKVLHLGNAGATVTANMLKMNVQVANANVDLNDYQVICALTYADEGYTTEPALKAKYVYSFVSPYEGKLSDNAITHTKEVVVTAADQTNGYVVIPIDSYYEEIAGDFGVNAYDMGHNLHIRWYVEHNDERYFQSEQLLEPVNNGIGYKVHNSSAETEGSLYWNTSTANLSYNPQGNFNIKFTPLSSDLIWENYKIIAVLTNDISAENGQVVSGGELVREPQSLNVQYTFSLIDGVFKFVHYKGASGRDYLTTADDSNISSSAPATQYSWDNDNNRVVAASANNIRQGVHTVNYDVFINPNDGPKILKLPFEAYEGTNGNNLEPMAYIRWYDWATDLGSTHLNQVGTWLNELTDVCGNRGLFMLNNSVSGLKPTQGRVGVTYDPSSLTTTGDIIACDVSKYYDGLYPGTESDPRADFSGRMYPQFIHEPTLSTRYLFHVYPSSVIAAELKAGHDKFDEAFYKLQDGTWTYNTSSKAYMFNDIYEDNGRVVVSVNGSTGTFALRADLYSINNYYINNGYSQCDHVTWRAYLEDERGLWRNDVPIIPSTNKRIELFDLSNLSGTYEYLGTPATTKYVTAAPGMRFHVVGFVGAGDEENAAVHYELQFLDAPAILADNLAATDMKRTSAYLEQHFRKGGEVTFDNFFADKSEPTSESNNMLFSPLPWEEAEYGFCYPTIDKYRIRTGWSGITPIHGDYMLVKSVKKANVSAQCDDSGDVPATGCEYAYHWYTWNPAIMYDYTHQLNSSEYGGYIYVDASDESRTIATLDFDASLCSGSQIYFTAAIADLTSAGATSPQLMAHVYANGSNGEKIQVLSFLTSVLNTVNAGDGGDYKYNKWYQVYGHGSVPENIDISNYTSFSVVIDNYSKDTNGADFCVDQIVFYTSTGKMHVEQTGAQCEDQNMKVTAYMDVEHLEAMMTLGETAKTLYYRLFKKTGESGGAVQYVALTDASVYGNGTNGYGQVDIYKYVLNDDGSLVNSEPKNAGYEVRNGILYFNLFKDKEFNLPQGEEYFIGMTENLEAPNLNVWANPNDACDVYSNFFVPRKTFISFLDSQSHSASTTIISNCENYAANDLNYTVKAVVPDENDPSGFKTISGVKYDFFIGTVDELKTGGAYAGLFAALRSYRDYETNNLAGAYKNYLDGGFNSYNSSYYTTLDNAIQAGKLMMSASENLTKTVLETTDFVAIPVKEVYRVGDTDYYLCDYFPFTITVDGYPGIPELTLGFDDVDYSAAGTERVLRVGLEQLNKMRTQGYKLHIPVNMYKDKNKLMTKKLYFPSDSYLTLSATNDNTQSTGKNFAKIVPNSPGDSRPSVDKEHMYLSLDLSGSNCAIDFHEGYQYEVSISYLDEDDENVTNPCIGDLFILIKVVPEFVTWYAQNVDDDGKPTDAATDYWSANWYNDGNWHRSVRSELYKDTNNSDAQQNTPTKGHPNGYDNNGEGTLIGLSSISNPGFVPMKFTYVTLPTGNNAPSLINEPRVVGEGKGSRRQGGGFLDTNRTTLLTDRSPNANTDGMTLNERHSSKPTENIYYDMLVRYSATPGDQYGEGCFGHRYIKDDGTWDDQGVENLTLKVFDVEKYQGNVCREIYFKPGAELLRPHRLKYEKAWVEKEMDANKWYLVSVPMKDTYAGDMYVPTSMTDLSLSTPATVKGRQVTEAFQPITFSTSETASTSTTTYQPAYSRTKYPIYQRSWGMNNGNVYTKENDIRTNSYSANLKYTTVTTNLAEWGHTFNDVQVPYNTLTAFSMRAHKKDQTDKVLIRLPKADTSYDYYDWGDNSSTPDAGDGIKSVDKTDIYELVSDYQDDTDTETSPIEFNISAMQQIGDYVLVGNPFMVSLDMKKFFETNSTLSTDGYWTYEGSVAEAHAIPTLAKTTVIKPLQAFFVKKGSATKITFNKEMQIDGNFPTPLGWGGGSARQTTVTLSAANSRGSSSASLEVNDKASAGYAGGEDVETLFDSNLSDVPMVYTVAADGQAVSINQLPALEVVPFGVSCSGDEMIDVTVDHSVYVFDALLGTTTAVNEGESVSIQPNDYGRYYLTVSEDASGLLTNKAVAGITISVRDRVVTVTSNDDINQVKAVNVSGATAYESTVGSKTTQFTLPTGTYIIDVNGVSGSKTVKILVK